MSTAGKFFKLDEELIDQIVFGMENQEMDMILDSHEAMVISSEEVEDLDEDPERYLDLPGWGPSDGFMLMEQFTAGLHNPACRQQLREALSSGRGVFRKFKEILGAFPPVKELWYSFKAARMRSAVVEWYNSLADAAEMARYDENYEETEIDDLALSDFTIEEEVLTDLPAMLEAEKMNLCANLPGNEALAELLFELRRGLKSKKTTATVAGEFLYLSARAPDGQLAGFAYGQLASAGGTRNAVCRLLRVEESWRGLGLGSELLEKFSVAAFNRGAQKLILEVSGSGLDFSINLEERGFVQLSTVYLLEKPKLR
ncbi:MAG: GNAT family N-acetyltransferase [Spirochaetes bacterium]|nr:GNAT family N-acetyltransferase [Spirochaetota bacterium]